MEKLQQALSWLRGKKTYLLAAAGVAWALSGYLLGNLDGETASRLLWESLTAAALRNGLKQ